MANSKSGLTTIITVVLLAVALLVVKKCGKQGTQPKSQTARQSRVVKNVQGLDRNPSAVNYSKHARCRMDCRHISESEVMEILHNGRINYNKSEIGNNTECNRKYAVEGLTHDDQKVRIIFAPCNAEVTVVTVIDLGKEWTCDCN